MAIIIGGGSGGGGGGSSTAAAQAAQAAADAAASAAAASATAATAQATAAASSASAVAAAVTISTIPFSNQTSHVALNSAHAGKRVNCSSAGNINVTVQPDATVDLPIGTIIEIARRGTGSVTIIEGAGVTINSILGAISTATVGNQFSSVALVKLAANEWDLVGDIA